MVTRDIISNLPTNIRETILTCLPLRDTVRASILSRKWKYCWIHLSDLVFDETMFQVSANDDKFLARQKYVSIINQILLFHQGPILKFSFSHSLFENGPEIDHIISFVSTSHVKEFDLRIGKGSHLSSWSCYSYMEFRDLVVGCYKLPSSFFSCRELKHLVLADCIFSPPPEFKGFPKLISLKFAFVYLPTDLSENFISKCPLLERLTLIYVYGSHSFEISAPKLNYMCFKESWLPLSFVSVPRLQSAYIEFAVDDERNGSLIDFFGCVSALNKLIVNQIFFEQMAAGLPTFTNLKVLQLKGISVYALDKRSSLYFLINSSPSLQRIEIEMRPSFRLNLAANADCLMEHDYAAEIILDELVEVCITYFTGSESEMEFIKLLLTKSSVLEKVRIENTCWTENDRRLKLLKEIVRFKRASPAAEIIYD